MHNASFDNSSAVVAAAVAVGLLGPVERVPMRHLHFANAFADGDGEPREKMSEGVSVRRARLYASLLRFFFVVFFCIQSSFTQPNVYIQLFFTLHTNLCIFT